MGNEVVRGGGAIFVKPGDGIGRKGRDITVELVFKAAIGVHKSDFLAMGGLMKGLEIMESELAALVCRAPERSGGSIAEKAQAYEHAGLVVEVEGGGGDLHRDRCDESVGVRCEHTPGGLEQRQGGPAAKAEEILEKGARAQAQTFGNVAAKAGA
jgi:hypothetical protein